MPDTPRAIDEARANLQGSQHSLGNDDPETLAAMKALALAYSDADDFAQARELLERVLSIQIRLVTVWDDQVADTGQRLGTVLCNAGQLVDAKTLQEQVLDYFRSRCGNDGFWTLFVCAQIAPYFVDGRLIVDANAFRLVGAAHAATTARPNY